MKWFKVLAVLVVVCFAGCVSESPPVQRAPLGKYRVVHLYGPGTTETTDYWKAYQTDDVKYDGPWVKFYDKSQKQWMRISGIVRVEGGEN